MHRFTRYAACTFLTGLSFCWGVGAQGQATPSPASEAFLIDQNRAFVALEFVRPDGTRRKTLAFVDSGSPSLALSRTLAKQLHIEKASDITVRFAGMPLRVPSDTHLETDDGASLFAGMAVEANLPATILEQYDVVFDYGNRTLTLAPPGSRPHEGTRVPCKVNPKTGLISVRAEIAGQSYALAVDTGSAYTWMDQSVTRRWADAHPQWMRGTAAVGNANMNGSLPELTGMVMRVPAVDLSGVQIESVGVLGVGPGWNTAMPKFFDWYSQKTPEAVEGFLGGNVLRAFRMEIDYEKSATYWSRTARLSPHDLDQVGIMIRPAPGGRYFVAALATQNGKTTVQGIAVADQLISIDGFPVTGATMGKVLAALHGRPGQKRRLVLEHSGRKVMSVASVTRF